MRPTEGEDERLKPDALAIRGKGVLAFLFSRKGGLHYEAGKTLLGIRCGIGGHRRPADQLCCASSGQADQKLRSHRRNMERPMYITTYIVRSDGTWDYVEEYIVPSRSGKPRRTILIKGRGKLELLKDGKAKSVSGFVETWTLHEGDGKRLISTADPACMGQYTQIK